MGGEEKGEGCVREEWEEFEEGRLWKGLWREALPDGQMKTGCVQAEVKALHL